MCRPRGPIPFSLLLVLLFVAGCATTPRPSYVELLPELNISRDGLLRYRVPQGWYDATRENGQSNRHAILLVRRDYAAIIKVTEIHLDNSAARVVREKGLLEIARLTMSLDDGKDGWVLTSDLEDISRDGRPLYSYDLLNSTTRDIERVILLEVASHIYEVRALVVKAKGRATPDQIYPIQEAFITEIGG